MTTAEVMTFSILCGDYFQGDQKKAHFWLRYLGYFPSLLSRSRINRRAQNIPKDHWMAVFRLLAHMTIQHKSQGMYAVDSFPIPCCQKNRIDSRRLYLGKEYISYAPSKKQFFCGLRVHMVVTTEGCPVEFCFRPASHADITVLWTMELELPKSSVIYADAAYASEELRSFLFEEQQLCLLAQIKNKRSKRKHSKWRSKEINSRRQRVETVFSSICRRLPRALHVRTEKGFELRLYWAILGYYFSLYKSP